MIIRLFFTRGSDIMKIMIHGRTVELMTKNTNFVPLKINLDKIKDSEAFKKLDEEQLGLLYEIKELQSEVEMAEDIKKDFKITGWRLLKETYGDN